MKKAAIKKAKKTREKNQQQRNENIREIYRLIAEIELNQRKLNSVLLRTIP